MIRKLMLKVCIAPLLLGGILTACSNHHELQLGERARSHDSVEASHKLTKQERQEKLRLYRQEIKFAKSKYGGPQRVKVVEPTNSAFLPDGHSYTATWLQVEGAHPERILVWVRTELVSHTYLKHWYCARPSRDCDPAIGFTYEADYSGHPYDGEVDGINQKYGKTGR